MPPPGQAAFDATGSETPFPQRMMWVGDGPFACREDPLTAMIERAIATHGRATAVPSFSSPGRTIRSRMRAT
jgi:hypothetical protein